MSLFDFLFPQQAAVSHLKTMANQQRRAEKGGNARLSSLESRVEELEHDTGVLALALAAILDSANENGSISRDEIKEKVLELDVLDGFHDGRINVAMLRKWIG